MRVLLFLPLLVVSGSAWAQDDTEGVSAPITPAETTEPAPLDGTIVKVPTGSQVSILDEDDTFTPYGVPSKYWLLPDTTYRNAVTAGKQINICQPALDRCTETALSWQERTYSALETCSDQFDVDGDRLMELESMNAQLGSKLSRARSNQVVAWAITSGLLVGAGTAVAVSFAAK